MGIKIERVILRQIRMPLVHFFETSFGRTFERHMVLVEVVADGASGWAKSPRRESFLQRRVDRFGVVDRPRLRGAAGSQIRIDGAGRNGIADVAYSRPPDGSRRGSKPRSGPGGAQNGVSLAKQIGGGSRDEIGCGVSIGIQDSVPQLIKKIETEVNAGYQRIKMKIKPGWDVDVIREVRASFPNIRLMADANSAYTLADADRLKKLDEFNLMMIEQPLAHDEIIDHVQLQAQLKTPICLDECIRSAHQAEQAIRMKACGIITSSWAASEASRKRNACTTWQITRGSRVVRRHARIRHRARAQTSHFRRCRISFFPAMFPPASDIGLATSSRRPWRSPPKAPSPFPQARASVSKSTMIS